MAAVTRGWVVGAIALGAIGILFLLWGFGVDLGRWWPLVFSLFGIASFARGMVYRENTVFGFLLLGWGVIGVLALHHEAVGIVLVWPFLIGASILWIPISVLLGRLTSPGS